MTPMELNALCEVTLKSNPRYVEPISEEEFAAMKAKFPDQPRKTETRNGH